MLSIKPEDPRPKKEGWAPGTYSCKCLICLDNYIGDKRSWNCADCAYKLKEHGK